MRVAPPLLRRIILAVLISTAHGALGQSQGLWLLARKDPRNTARADVAGAMKDAPVELWAFGGDPNQFTYAAPVTIGGIAAYFCQVHSGLRVVRPDGAVVWDRPALGVSAVIAVDDFDGDGASEALVQIGSTSVALIDGATAATRWTWSVPAGALLAPNGSYKVWRRAGDRAAARFIVFPQNSLRGVCIDLSARGEKPPVLWDRAYTGYWMGFGPQIVLADLDKDGAADVVLAGKPGYAAVIDAETGAVKFDVHYDVAGEGQLGRPYGLLTAVDMDGDGFPDVAMISCQVEEYGSILRNEGGKALRPVWSKFIEHDLPDDLRELRPNVTSLADLDGDGRRELVLGLFNVTGDGKWHTVVIDPMRGFDARRADLPGRYFWGCYDLDGDGRPEIITSDEPARKPAVGGTTVQAVDGRTFRDVAGLKGAKLATAATPLAADAGFLAIRATPRFCRMPDGERGLLLSSVNGGAAESLWSIREGRSRVVDAHLSSLASLVALSSGGEVIDQPDRAIQSSGGAAVIATAPLVGVAGGKRELVFALSNGTVMGGEVDLAASGKFKSSWTVPGEMPALWVGPNGDRVVCTVSGDQTVLLSRPGTTRPSVKLELPHPMYRNGATRSGPTVLPFGHESLRVYVGLQTGVHTMASALFDGEGKRLWVDEKEGPYPRTAALAELDGRDTLVVDNHGKHLFYDLAGKSRLIAHGWNETVPGREDGAKYVVPIVGPFGPAGETRVLMSSGLQALETLDATGRRLAKHDFASTYEYEWNGSAVGRFGAGVAWDLAMVNKEGKLTCFDAATCKPRWTFDLGCGATRPINLVSADVDGDGRDNLLAGLPDGTLVALDEREGKAVVLWKLKFACGVRDTIVADVDGDGKAKIIVETEEGRVHVMGAR